jgi:hypothetical protein
VSLAFVCCVERGALESQALLLVQSLRRFGGRFRDAPVHTFAPRRGRGPRVETVDRLEALGAVHHRVHGDPPNRDHPDDAFANKIFVSARAEEVLAEDVLVFLDTDTLVTGEPAELDLPEGIDFAALPVSNARRASQGPSDRNEPYWRGVYQICGIREEPYVRTVVDGRCIRAYFNSGLVAVRRSAGLFGRWRDDFLRLLRARHTDGPPGRTGMDEVALAATLGRASARGRVLDLRYNYPLQQVERRLLPPPWRHARLEDLAHVHYRFWLHLPGFLRQLDPPLDPEDEVFCWLEPRLPLGPVVDAAWVAVERHVTSASIHDLALAEEPR